MYVIFLKKIYLRLILCTYLQDNNDVLSFDILLNYTGLSAKTLAEFHAKLDHPSNIITLQYDVHTGFDKYRWCFLRTKVRLMVWLVSSLANNKFPRRKMFIL